MAKEEQTIEPDEALKNVDINTLSPDEQNAAVDVPDSGDTSAGGKLKMIIQLMKRSLGVKDLAAMRLSLPASLLEPIPNLEYWTYLDRPDLLAAINDSPDALQRILAVIRFAFSKDLKHVRGKVCKPYNSVLGEHFQAHWDIIPLDSHFDGPPKHHEFLIVPDESSKKSSETASIKSARSAAPSPAPATPGKRGWGMSYFSTPSAQSSVTSLAAQTSQLSLSGKSDTSGQVIETDLNGAADKAERIRVAYLTEQVSHHPPISAYYASCPSKGVEQCGVDQIAARVTGTGVRIGSGAANKGIFVRLTSGYGSGETYRITHPTALINGVLRGSLYVTISESCIITCSSDKPGENLRAIIEYKEETMFGRAQYALEGVIHTYNKDETTHEEWTRVKHVPAARVLATFEGCWRGTVKWKKKGESTSQVLVDLNTLAVIPKSVRPISKQTPKESRRIWEEVTSHLLEKEFSEATKVKHEIEQRQRDEAAARKSRGEEFVPVYFEKDYSSGQPVLTEAGSRALEGELKEAEDAA